MSKPTPTIDELKQAVAARRSWAVELLSGWIRHPSVLGQEKAAQEHVAGFFGELGLEARFEVVDLDAIRSHRGFSPVDWSYEDRPNLVGAHEPKSTGGRSLILNGHVDVVSPEPTALWSTPPYEPRVVEDEEDGEAWLYGRGAADMKGGSVSGLWALAALRDLGWAPAASFCFQSPIEEECTGNGTLDLCLKGYDADGVVIPEPFDERLLTHQIGVMWFQVRIIGKTTHVLGAGRGVNAIEKSFPIVAAMRELEAELNDPKRRPDAYADVDHPLNLNVGTIQGGDWQSTVAGECVVGFRIGLFEGTSREDLKSTIEERVAAAAAQDPWLRDNPPTVEYIGFQAEGCHVDPDSPLCRVLSASHERLHGRPAEPLRATCTTDIRHFNLYKGTPALCYGPKGRAFHAADEKVSIDSMQRVATVLGDFIGTWCGLETIGAAS
jgi:acetylornithine deacetylase